MTDAESSRPFGDGRNVALAVNPPADLEKEPNFRLRLVEPEATDDPPGTVTVTCEDQVALLALANGGSLAPEHEARLKRLESMGLVERVSYLVLTAKGRFSVGIADEEAGEDQSGG